MIIIGNKRVDLSNDIPAQKPWRKERKRSLFLSVARHTHLTALLFTRVASVEYALNVLLTDVQIDLSAANRAVSE